MYSFWNFPKKRSTWLLMFLACSLLISMTLTVIFLILTYQGCEEVKSCVYSLGNIESPDCIVFYYEYVINNRTGCRMWCSNPMDWASCPLDGSSCDVTHFVHDYCKYNGFSDIFDCGDSSYYTVSMMFALITVISGISGLMFLCTWRGNATDSEETIPFATNAA